MTSFLNLLFNRSNYITNFFVITMFFMQFFLKVFPGMRDYIGYYPEKTWFNKLYIWEPITGVIVAQNTKELFLGAFLFLYLGAVFEPILGSKLLLHFYCVNSFTINITLIVYGFAQSLVSWTSRVFYTDFSGPFHLIYAYSSLFNYYFGSSPIINLPIIRFITYSEVPTAVLAGSILWYFKKPTTASFILVPASILISTFYCQRFSDILRHRVPASLTSSSSSSSDPSSRPQAFEAARRLLFLGNPRVRSSFTLFQILPDRVNAVLLWIFHLLTCHRWDKSRKTAPKTATSHPFITSEKTEASTQ